MLYFKTRTLARNFAVKVDYYKVVDNGNVKLGRRWGVKVL